MSQIAQDPSYLSIADQLDAVGQKYRVQRLVRGAVLFVAVAAFASVAAALAAHFVGQSAWTWIVFAAWMAMLVAGFGFWIVRPLMIRPRPVEVARLIETRVDGLHNGLTNSVLLADAPDLQNSPWLPRIFAEIAGATQTRRLGEAVRMRDLRPLATRAAVVLAVLIGLICIPLIRHAMQHGWRQMLHPTAFVPKVGAVEIIDVRPKNVTLMLGQSLEIAVTARDPKNLSPMAAVVFENHKVPMAELAPTVARDDGSLSYSYRLDNVQQSMRYRIEIAGTQSPWFDVTVVKQVKLEQLALSITPPAYTGMGRRDLVLKGDELTRPVVLPESSDVEVTALLDLPVSAALLQVGDNPDPLKMKASPGDRRFSGALLATTDASLAVKLLQGDQIVDSLPDPPLRLAVTHDAPPVVEMRWPTQDLTVPLDQEIRIRAVIRDDYGISAARVLSATAANQPLTPVVGSEPRLANAGASVELDFVLPVDKALRVHGGSIRVQVEAMDNRRIPASSLAKELGPQSAASSIYEIKFSDPRQLAREEKERTDKLRAILLDMLQRQQKLHEQTVAWKPSDKAAMPKIKSGQYDLQVLMQGTAETYAFEPETKVVQKTLLLLSLNPAREAVEIAGAIPAELVEKEQLRLSSQLQSRQRRIIETLESLLAVINRADKPATQPTTRRGGDLTSDQREQFKKLDEALKQFMKEERRILDQTAALAKKPVDNWDAADKKLLEELKMAQDKMDAFMQEKVNDFSKLAEQDMANASLLRELLEVYSEVTMAKDALKQKAVEIAVPLEESGLELAKELSSNLEKWLSDAPDRQKWTMEEPTGKNDVPMAELPKELEDMIGKLLEQQEDLFEQIEDASSSWADSLDKGAGWDAADGPIANMSAKGVTGNQLPNNNEINGRSGEGRNGKSSGEMVEDTASGKGGRNTPTRLDPTPFQQGQVKDQSKDPTGGATGGGKTSGQGGAGLEGPLAPKSKEEMQRLTAKQAELRNTAERIELKYQLGKYDNFKLLESIALMRRVESDLKSNRYENALRRRDMTLDALDTSHLLLGGQVHVQHDTTPHGSQKMQEQINDAMKGQLPAAWSEALKEYYRKLAEH